MKTSAESMEWYHRSNQLWKDSGIGLSVDARHNETVDFKTAKNCIKRFWRKEMGRPFIY